MFHLLQDGNGVFVFFCKSDDVLRSTGRSSQLCHIASFESEKDANAAKLAFELGYTAGLRDAAYRISDVLELSVQKRYVAWKAIGQ